MLNFFKTLLCGVIVMVFASCGKEPLPVYPPVIPDIRLTQYIEIDSVAGSTPDTATIVKLEYDALKRLISLTSYYSTDSADQLVHYERFNYQYNGTDTLPLKMVYNFREGDASNYTILHDTSFYTYNTVGKILTDSTIYNDSSNLGNNHYYTTKRYNYLDNYFIVYNAEESNGTLTQTYDSVAVNISGNNISSLSRYTYSLPDSLPVFNYTGSFTYDNNPNPFRIAALYPTYQVFGYDSGFGSLLQLNNVTAIAKNNSNGETSNETATYTYNDNGYPSGFVSNYTNNGITRTYRGVFIYN